MIDLLILALLIFVLLFTATTVLPTAIWHILSFLPFMWRMKDYFGMFIIILSSITMSVGCIVSIGVASELISVFLNHAALHQ